jgi:hypothetical protein
MNVNEFKAQVSTATSFLGVVQICLAAANDVEAESPTLPGQKRKYSDLRKSFNTPDALTLAKSLPWSPDLSRTEFSNNVLEAITRKVWKAPESTLKAAVVLALVKLHPNDTSAYKAAQVGSSKAAQLEGVEVDNPLEYIKRARQLAKSPFYTQKVVGLAALTGRRVFEVACQATFEPVSPMAVAFKGRAKNAKATDESALIPTLVPANEVVEYLESLRSIRPDLVGLTDKQFNDKASKTLNEVAKKKLGVSKPKDTRGIYAAICHSGINKRRSGQNAYYSMVLAHDEKDMSAKDYQKFFVPDQYLTELTAYFDNLKGV